MPTKVIVTRLFSVPPNTEAYEAVYTVSPGSRFTLKKVKVHFPVGVASQLLVRILQGWTSVAPVNGYFVGDDVVFEHEVEAEYGSGSVVRAYIRNISGASTKECTITIEGEES
jgi:hypothetical protein